MRARQSRGFTLLEILVAMAILAVALGALVKASSAHTENATYLRDKVFAQWVAQNRLATHQVMGDWPRPGNTRGTELLAQREWHWLEKVEDTPDKSVRRMSVEVRVNEDDEGVLTTLTGFLLKP